MRTSTMRRVVPAALIAVTTIVLVAQGQAMTHDRVMVPRGQPLQVAFTAITTEGDDLASFSRSFENAIRMAVDEHPAIRGFPVRVNVVETSCGGDNTEFASQIVENAENVAVIGNLCSDGFESALPIYEEAGVVAISGSASRDSLPALGPTMFNRTIVRDGDGGADWYETVSTLPHNAEWQEAYRAEFDETPMPLSDLYFDAASLLLKRLQQVSRIMDGALVVDRAALGRSVRETTRYQGVSCKVAFDAAGNRLNDPSALLRCAED